MKRVIFALAAAVLTSAPLGCCATHCDAPRCCQPFACGVFGNWGCGGLYRGDWFSEPPDYCTHCDHYGNVTQAGYHDAYDDDGYYEAGYDAGPIVPDGYHVIDDRAVSPQQQPTPANPPAVPARPTARTRRPSRAY
ncbi:MAG: hypothetical protein HY000_25575 [Planctomycetes bacterium]|nr:hypothetical protein [Planctomycetota bacterium]